MKGARQISRQGSHSEEEDQPDARYNKFQNKTSDGSQKSDASDEQRTVGDFVNPVYRDKNPSVRSNQQQPRIDQDPAEYDSLKFRSNSNDSKRHLDNDSKPPPKYPSRTDITKPPEEFEMGVSNYGYDNEKARPASWDKSLASFSPYAVDTPIGGPIDSRGNSLSVPEKRYSSSSKNSDYSFVSGDGDENPYAAPKGPQYEDLPAMRQKGQLPPPRQGTKKANLAYESAVITTSREVRRTSSTPADPKHGYEADESSSCCHVIFTILVGILALLALVVVFLVVFGVISAKKCNECEVTTVSTSSPQTGGSTGGNTGTDNKEILLELQYLRNNMSALKKQLENSQQASNQSGKIILLENEVSEQKLQVQALTDELARQRNITKNLNQTVEDLNITIGPPGPAGPPGINGTIGPRGPDGPGGANLTDCVYGEVKRRTPNNFQLAHQNALKADEVTISAVCTHKNAVNVNLVFDQQTKEYSCECDKESTASELDCNIHFWICPK